MSEIALAVVLLVGAGLMMKSLFRLLQANVGFDPQNVLTMSVVLPAAKYTDVNRQVAFFDQLKERVRSLPGVNGVGTVNILPLQAGNTTRFSVEGDPGVTALYQALKGKSGTENNLRCCRFLCRIFEVHS